MEYKCPVCNETGIKSKQKQIDCCERCWTRYKNNICERCMTFPVNATSHAMGEMTLTCSNGDSWQLPDSVALTDKQRKIGILEELVCEALTVSESPRLARSAIQLFALSHKDFPNTKPLYVDYAINNLIERCRIIDLDEEVTEEQRIALLNEHEMKVVMFLRDASRLYLAKEIAIALQPSFNPQATIDLVKSMAERSMILRKIDSNQNEFFQLKEKTGLTIIPTTHL